MQNIFYSKTTKGFYDSDIHGNNMPSDAYLISKQYHEELLIGQTNGFAILADQNGRPYLGDHTPIPLTLEEKEYFRLQMYRDEADPLFFKWQRGEIEKQVWLDKVEEIKQAYPE